MIGGGKRAQERQAWRDRLAHERAERFNSMREQLAVQSERMRAEAATRRGTRKRGLPLAAAGFGILGFLLSMVYQSVLAVNFTTGNSEMEIYSNYLDAAQAQAYLAPTSKANNAEVGSLQLGIKTGKLAGFCAIAKQSILTLPYSLVITAGQTIPDSFSGAAIPSGVTTSATTGVLTGTSLTEAITANNLFLDSTGINGYGNLISGMNLGQSADTLAASSGLNWPANQDTMPTAGNFGLYANQLNVAGLGGTSYGLNLEGNITLPKLKIAVVSGNKSQADCG